MRPCVLYKSGRLLLPNAGTDGLVSKTRRALKPGHPFTGLRLFGQSLAHTRSVSLEAWSANYIYAVRAACALGQQHPNVRVDQRARHCSRIGVPMPQRRYIVLIETAQGRMPARFTVPPTATQVDVAMQVRERDFEPYPVQFDPGAGRVGGHRDRLEACRLIPVCMCAPPGFRGRHGTVRRVSSFPRRKKLRSGPPRHGWHGVR